jgi:hypothetical protein
VVQDPTAVLTLPDRLVPLDLDVELQSQLDSALETDTILGLGYGSTTRLCDTLEELAHILGQLRENRVSFFPELLRFSLQRGAERIELVDFTGMTFFAFLDGAFFLFHAIGECVDPFHLGQNQVLALGDFAIDDLDLMEYCGVFLVRLHVHQLRLETGTLRLEVLQVPFLLAPFTLTSLQGAASLFEPNAFLCELRVCRCALDGDVRESVTLRPKFVLELLKANQFLEIGVHP